MRYLIIIITLLPVFNSNTAWSSNLSDGSLKLGCEFIYPIEKQFLSDSLVFNNFDPILEKRVIDQYLKQLDGLKIYFTEDDIKKINNQMSGLFERIQKGQCSDINSSYDLLKKRIDERVAFVKTTLNDKFVLNKKAQLILDPDSRDFPKSASEHNEFHRTYLDFQIATYLATDSTLEEAKEKVIASYERFRKSVNARSQEDLYALFLESFALSLDPHSSFFSREELEDFEIQMKLSLEGIGASLSSKDGIPTVEQLVTGGAADRSGKLKPLDKVIAVSQPKNATDFQDPVNVIEMELSDVVRQIRGPKGTRVKLTVLRKEGPSSKKIDVMLVRDKINLEDEALSIHYLDRKMNGEARKVALINLPSFYGDPSPIGRSAAKDLKNAIADARKNKAESIVLDLSANGGGYLDSAVKIAGLFLKTGNIVEQSGGNSSKGELLLADVDSEVDWSGPLVVLTSRLSASASEIVAGTLQDYKRAVIIGGDHTFGKGTVQAVMPLAGGLGAFKTTIGMFFTAGGESTQRKGVVADITLPSVFSNDEIGEIKLDFPLPQKKVNSFLSRDAYVSEGPGSWSIVDKNTLAALKKDSSQRVKSNKDFNKIKDDIAKADARGKVVKVSDILGDDAKETNDEKNNATLSKAEKTKKYLERPDIQEAVNVAVDLFEYQKRPHFFAGDLIAKPLKN